jgi:hypothetical protein
MSEHSIRSHQVGSFTLNSAIRCECSPVPFLPSLTGGGEAGEFGGGGAANAVLQPKRTLANRGSPGAIPRSINWPTEAPVLNANKRRTTLLAVNNRYYLSRSATIDHEPAPFVELRRLMSRSAGERRVARCIESADREFAP